MANKYEQLLDKKRTEFIDNFWLNLGDTSNIKTLNTLAPKTEWERENPLLFLVDYMRKPENFSFTCEYLLNIKIHPFQAVALKELAIRPFPMLIGTRGFSKSFLLGLHALLTAIFQQGSKIVITAAAFRQAKHVFEYTETVWKNSSMLQDILSDDKMNRPTRDIDRCTFRIGQSKITSLPLGTGEKIRGERSTHLFAEEFNSIPAEIYEHVVAGFAAVSASPIDNIIHISKLKALEALGEINDAVVLSEKAKMKSNQSVVCGTPGYDFENFSKYWKRYKSIIESKGNIDKLNEIFTGEIPLGFNWKDYSIIRVPFDLLPEGFLDIKNIGKSKATMHSSLFSMEYGAVFAKDSQGFFPRSLIERCSAGNSLCKINFPSCGDLDFSAVLKGEYDKKYYMAIDPASEIDNFTIVILEVWPEHRRVVYCWSINKERFKAKLKKGLAQEHDYFRYCARKIRDLKILFPCDIITIDTQGGGYSVIEALGDPLNLRPNESPFYPIIEEDDEKPTDDMVGLHIIRLIQFSDNLWVNEANNGLKMDMESKSLVFPRLDTVSIALALEEDKISGRVKIDPNDVSLETLFDTLEDCMMEIEEMKRELATIVHSKTEHGRDRWTTPELKIGIGKKGKLRKDRYSALLMANSTARDYAKMLPEIEYKAYGGIATHIMSTPKQNKSNELYSGPAWFTEALKKSGQYGVVVRKDR